MSADEQALRDLAARWRRRVADDVPREEWYRTVMRECADELEDALGTAGPQAPEPDPRLLAILRKAVGEWGLREVALAAAWMAGPPEGPA